MTTKAVNTVKWETSKEYSDIKYQKAEGIAKLTINRPEVRNAFRPQTIDQLQEALQEARNEEQ